MLMGHLAVDCMVLGVAMMMSMISMVPVMGVLAAFDRARERIRRMLLMKRMLRAIHKPDVALAPLRFPHSRAASGSSHPAKMFN